MSNRVTSAIASKRARETLLRLLFPKEPAAASSTATTTTCNHARNHDGRMNNSPASRTAAQNRHTHSQLRAAYIQKVHLLHPDKVAHCNHQNATNDSKQQQEQQQQHRLGNDDCQGQHQSLNATTTTTTNNKNTNNESNNSTTTSRSNNRHDNLHVKFIELKNAWEEYNATILRTTTRQKRTQTQTQSDYANDDGELLFWEEQENYFTMFGVGCSFDDSPEERDLRNDIMEQACRGWFSSGGIEEGVVKVGMNDASRDGIMGGSAQDGDEEEGETAASASAPASASASAGSTPNWMRSSKQHQVPVTLSDDDMFMTSSSVSAKSNNHERRNSSLVQNIDEIKKRRRCRKRE